MANHFIQPLFQKEGLRELLSNRGTTPQVRQLLFPYLHPSASICQLGLAFIRIGYLWLWVPLA